MIKTKINGWTCEDGNDKPLTLEQICKQKQALRAYMKKLRAENVNRDVKERLLLENFIKAYASFFPEMAGARIRRKVFCYLSYSREAPTDKLLQYLEERGVETYAPRVEGKEMCAVQIGEDFSLSAIGIREPIGKAYEGETDLIILPLLAVDKQGNRLGYGGGYYDKYLQTHTKAVRIGVCYDFQVVDRVPFEPTDEKIHCIVTDKRVLFVDK